MKTSSGAHSDARSRDEFRFRLGRPRLRHDQQDQQDQVKDIIGFCFLR